MNSKKETIEELTERFRKLDKKKTTAEANLKTACERLEELKKEAREKYETDDLQELKEKLTKIEKENEEKLSTYQQALNDIEKNLENIEKEYKGE